jgi:ABC-type transporter Mla subunit MlaD
VTFAEQAAPFLRTVAHAASDAHRLAATLDDVLEDLDEIAADIGRLADDIDAHRTASQ